MKPLPARLIFLIEALIKKGLITERVENGVREYYPTERAEPMMDLAVEGVYSCKQCFLNAVENLKAKNREDITITIYPIEKSQNRLCLGCFSKGKTVEADGILRMKIQ